MKFKDPFMRSDLQVRKRLECFEVGFCCRAPRGMSGPPVWTWKSLTAGRWSNKAIGEAKALALELMRESAARWEASANEALKAQGALLKECSLLEKGLLPWNPEEP